MTVLIFVFLCLLGEIIFLYLSFYHAAFIICWMVISTVSTDYFVYFFVQWAVFGGMGTCTFDTFCLFVGIICPYLWHLEHCGISLLVLGGSMLTLVLHMIDVLYMSLLLLTCSISIRNIESRIVVLLFVRLMILITLCSFSCTSVLMYSVLSSGSFYYEFKVSFRFWLECIIFCILVF